MAEFKAKDRVWKINLNVGLFGDIKRDLGVNLGQLLSDAEEFVKVMTDPETMVAILWKTCEEQATAAGITPEQFPRMFDGPTLDAAVEALLESAVDFFPKIRGRATVKKNLPRTLKQMEEEANRLCGERAAIQFGSTLSSTPGNSPASSTSTLAP